MHFQGPKIRLCEFTNTFLNSRESRAPPPFPGSMPWAYFKYISAHTNFFFCNRDKGNQVDNPLNFFRDLFLAANLIFMMIRMLFFRRSFFVR